MDFFDVDKIGFANCFGTFEDPDAELMLGEIGFDNDYRLHYKNMDGYTRRLMSITDYENIYTPPTMHVIQTSNSAKVGASFDYDYSDMVNTSFPEALTITAMDIHYNNALVHYDEFNTIKNVIPLPEYFCRIHPYADVFDVNNGIVTEYIKKIEIPAASDYTDYGDNYVFKIVKLDTELVKTTLNLSLTTEDNKNNPMYRNRMYVGSDNYLYIIKSYAETLPPFIVFNVRTEPVTYKMETSQLLLARNDMFKVMPYRRFRGIATDTAYQFVDPYEDIIITDVLRSQKIENSNIIYDVPLEMDGTGKFVTNLKPNFYYDIIVATNEVLFSDVVIEYDVLTISEGLFAYLYGILKRISPNNELNLINKIGANPTNYIYTYTYTTEALSETSFVIPNSVFSPVSGDTVLLFYQGLKLDENVNYTLNTGTNTVKLGFEISSYNEDSIDCMIIKCGSASYQKGSSVPYVYIPAIPTSSFVIPKDIFAPLNGDSIMIFYKGLKIYEGINYSLDKYTNTITLGFNISSADGDIISCEIFRYNVTQFNNNAITVSALNSTILAAQNICASKNGRCLLDIYATLPATLTTGSNRSIMQIESKYYPKSDKKAVCYIDQTNYFVTVKISTTGIVTVYNYTGVTLAANSVIQGQLTWDMD